MGVFYLIIIGGIVWPFKFVVLFGFSLRDFQLRTKVFVHDGFGWIEHVLLCFCWYNQQANWYNQQCYFTTFQLDSDCGNQVNSDKIEFYQQFQINGGNLARGNALNTLTHSSYQNRFDNVSASTPWSVYRLKWEQMQWLCRYFAGILPHFDVLHISFEYV